MHGRGALAPRRGAAADRGAHRSLGSGHVAERAGFAVDTIPGDHHPADALRGGSLLGQGALLSLQRLHGAVSVSYDQNFGLTEIYLHCATLILIMMTRSR
jgi:hypothetical protein